MPTFGAPMVKLAIDIAVRWVYNFVMKIFRILESDEYNYFLLKKSLFNAWQEMYCPEGMLFPENVDQYGKFFFFELEDLYNFVYNYSNATPNDYILELDIDRETALKYLSVANYYYFDPSRNNKAFTDEEIKNGGNLLKNLYSCSHAVPELFVNLDVVNRKIRKGEYTILSPETILKYTGRPISHYESNRNKKTLELAKRLDNVRKVRQKIRDAGLEIRILQSEDEDFECKKKLSKTEKKLKACMDELESAKNDVISYFTEFAREHEKYMALVPAPEESQPE